MSKVKFKPNRAGIGSLLKSAEMASIVGDYASKCASRSGRGYASETFNAGTRVVGKAYADTWEAKRDNAKNNTLLKNLRG